MFDEITKPTKLHMDDVEFEVFNPKISPNSCKSQNNDQNNNFPNEIVKHNTTSCTHIHTCNPYASSSSSSDAAEHTHTCYHTHTQVLSSTEDVRFPSLKPKTPLGNREAVRKYREKKKAHTAFLEAEVRKLRVLNQHLVRRVQVQVALEAELLSLRALLVYVRGKVDDELRCLSFPKHCNEVDLQFPVQNSCFATGSEAVDRLDTGENKQV